MPDWRYGVCMEGRISLIPVRTGGSHVEDATQLEFIRELKIARNPPRRRMGAALHFECADIAIALRGAIAKRMTIDDCSGGVQQLSIRADVDVARSVEKEVGPAEGAIGACRLVPDRDVRRDLTVHQPLEQPDRAINGVTCQPQRLKIEAALDTLNHRLGDANLGYTIGTRALGVDDDACFVVDEVVGVVSKKWISILPCNPSRLRIGQRDLFWRLASVAAAAQTTVIAAVLLIAGVIQSSKVFPNRTGRFLGLRPGNRLIARHPLLLVDIGLDQARID